MTPRRLLWSSCLAAVLAAGGCSGCDDVVTDISVTELCAQEKCRTSDDCAACGKTRHECAKEDPTDQDALGTCVETFLQCAQHKDCCPGESCLLSVSPPICADTFTQCQDDSSCAIPGQVCREFDTFRHEPSGAHKRAKRCTFERCGPDNTCAAGLYCFAGYCIGKDAFTVSAPGKTRLCNGGCNGREVCVPVNGRCMQPPDECVVQSCPPGYAIAFTDPDNVDDHCDLKKRQCGCAELPPLDSKDVGRWAAATVVGNEIWVSAYDGTYGDLVVAKYSLDGERKSVEYVDGVPENGVVVAGPSGARGGVADPGEDVGRYTDIVASGDGKVYVSYYDVTHKDLKLAYWDGAKWQTHTVDGSAPESDVGLYTSIQLIGGRPAIAYFQRAGAGTLDLKTGLKFAWASSAAPASSADWNVKLVDSADRPAPPCHAPACTSAQACVGTGPYTCKTLATGCTPACRSDEVCVAGTGAPACERRAPAPRSGDLPEGVGLMPSLAVMNDGSPVIAYYDRLLGALKAVKADPVGNFPAASAIPYLAGKSSSNTDLLDVGLFPSVAIQSDGKIAIAYQDATNDDLLLWTGAAPAAGVASTLVDDGDHAPGSGDLRMVGADAALVVSSGGQLYLAYQDSTAVNLRIKKLDGSTWASVKDVGEGAVGFFADAVAHQGKIYVSHVKIRATPAGLESTIQIEKLDAP